MIHRHSERMMQIFAAKKGAKKKKHSGAMLAIMAPASVASKMRGIVDKESISTDGLHMTLLYLGKANDLDKVTLEAVRKATERVCAQHAPLNIKVSGAGRFTPGDDGTPVYVVPNAKGLSALQADLENTISNLVDLPSEHGWAPHLTIGYSCDDDPKIPDISGIPGWTATKVRFQVGGDKVADIPLGSRKKASFYLSARTDEDDKSWTGKLEDLTEKNDNFREVLFTGKREQLVLMSLKGGEKLDPEVHEHVDQFFRVDQGTAIFVLDDKRERVKEGGGVLVPAGTRHEVINASKTEPLKFYTIYSPPNHPPGTVHKTKEEAEEAEKKYHEEIEEQHKREESSDGKYAASIHRILRAACTLNDSGDSVGIERFVRQFDFYLTRRDCSVLRSNANTPPIWKANYDYADNSPWYGMAWFKNRFPGGLKDYLAWRRKNMDGMERRKKLREKKSELIKGASEDTHLVLRAIDLLEAAWAKRGHFIPEGGEDDVTKMDKNEPKLWSNNSKIRDIKEFLEKFRKHYGYSQDADDAAALNAAREFVKYWALLLKKPNRGKR